MNLVILNQYALPAGSAGITRHGDIGAELVRRGHHVTVIASAFDYLRRQPVERQRPSDLTSEGVRFIWLQTGSYTANDRRRVRSVLRYTAKAAWAAACMRPRPDVIVASSPHPLVGLSAFAASKWLRIPWIFEARDIWPSALVDLGALRRGSAIHRGLEFVERFSYRASARVVVVPPRGADRLRELGIDLRKAVHIPNFANLARKGSPVPETLRQILDGLRGKFVIAYTGAVGVPNGLDAAIDGMQRLAERDPQVSDHTALLLVGGGVYREAIMQPGSRPWTEERVLPRPDRQRCHRPRDREGRRLPHADRRIGSFQLRLEREQALRLLRGWKTCAGVIGSPDNC